MIPPAYKTIDLRKSNPLMFYSIVALSLTRVALAVNFWTATLAFHPYNIHKDVTGAVFFILGVSQLIFLLVLHDLRLIRGLLAVSVFVTMAWGLANTQQFFSGNASLQLPILYVSLTVWQVLLLLFGTEFGWAVKRER